MKWILILSRDGKETLHRIDALTREEAAGQSEVLIRKEHKERQDTFPFTPEPPPNASLFCEFFEWLK